VRIDEDHDLPVEVCLCHVDLHDIQQERVITQKQALEEKHRVPAAEIRI